MKYGVFISYSHEDRKYVTPIVKLVKAMREDLVFQDTTDILPRKKWEPQLQKALDEAQILVLFWCRHAASSVEVKKEYQMAIKKNKDILPLLLDNSRLDSLLAGYQGIDLQEAVYHHASRRTLVLDLCRFASLRIAHFLYVFALLALPVSVIVSVPIYKLSKQSFQYYDIIGHKNPYQDWNNDGKHHHFHFGRLGKWRVKFNRKSNEDEIAKKLSTALNERMSAQAQP